MNYIIYSVRQWRLRKIKRNEESTRRLMNWAGLDYDDVNLRRSVKVAIKESDEWLKKHGVH